MKKDLWDDFYEQFVELGGEDDTVTIAEGELSRLIETHPYFVNARKRPPLTEEQEAIAAKELAEFEIIRSRLR